MWQRDSTEIDALRSKHGSPESRRELRRKLRYQSSPESHGFVLASSKRGTRTLPPAKNKNEEGVDGTPASQRYATSAGKTIDVLATNTQLLRESDATPDKLPSLLRLPLELRQEIYKYLFPYNDQHLLQTRKWDMPVPNFVITNSEDSKFLRLWGERGQPVGAHTAIMRLNKQLHLETHAYLYRNSIIRINVAEDGYSFLESQSRGYSVTSKLYKKKHCDEFESFKVLSPMVKDRDTEWHQRFLSNFDFSLPKKLIISIEAATHDNPKETVQIRQSMIKLCNLLRKYPKIRCLEIIPQSQAYRPSKREGRFGSNSTRGSYFIWETNHRRKPSRKKPFQLGVEQEPVWGGKLEYLVLDKLPDLALVLSPLEVLRNVLEMSVKLPPTTADLAGMEVPINRICNLAKGETSSDVVKDIARNDRLTGECRQRLKEVAIRKKIKKAERTKAKDQWYGWNCKTCGEEFTEHGEEGYESSDDADW